MSYDRPYPTLAEKPWIVEGGGETRTFYRRKTAEQVWAHRAMRGAKCQYRYDTGEPEQMGLLGWAGEWE